MKNKELGARYKISHLSTVSGLVLQCDPQRYHTGESAYHVSPSSDVEPNFPHLGPFALYACAYCWLMYQHSIYLINSGSFQLDIQRIILRVL